MNQLGTIDGTTENPVSGREPSYFQGEPEFLVSDRANLQIGPENVTSATAQYLDYQVLRYPHVLSNHIRRIYMYSALSDADSLYGSLVDLLIVLNGQGANLRKRMLQCARPILNKECYDRLSECDGIVESEPRNLPSHKACLLGNGIIGTDQLVVLSEDKACGEIERDPLIDARDHIEYSQIEAARRVLEQAILDAPERKELHEELLGIYRSIGNDRGVNEFLAKLNGIGHPYSELWSASSVELASVR